MALTVKIGGVKVIVLLQAQQLQTIKRLNQRSTASFGVLGTTASALSENMPVTIDDSLLGNLFTGFVDSIENDPYTNTTLNMFIVVCKDMRYLADKRYYTGDEFLNVSSGDIVCLLHSQVLVQEGILANYVQTYASNKASWNTGALTTVTGDSGSLTLSASGTSASYDYPAYNAFNETGVVYSGTMVSTNKVLIAPGTQYSRNWNDNTITSQTYFNNTNYVASGGFSYTISGSQAASSGKYTHTVTTPSVTISNDTGDCQSNMFLASRFDAIPTTSAFILEMDIGIARTVPTTSNNCMAFSNQDQACILYCTSYWGTAWNSFGYAVILDLASGYIGLGYGANANASSYTLITSTNVSLASGTMYHVKIEFFPGSHKIYFNNSMTPTLTSNDSVYTSGQIGVRTYISTEAFGYAGPNGNGGSASSASYHGYYDNLVYTPYSLASTWTAASKSISAVGTVGSSQIAWTPNNTSGNTVTTFSVSLNAGSTWQSCSNGGVIPGCTPGTNLSGKSILVKALLTTNDLTKAPELDTLSWSIIQAYNTSGNRVSLSMDASALGYVGGSTISYATTTPVNTTAIVSVSTDNGLTYTNVASGSTIPGLVEQPELLSDIYDTNTSANYVYDTYGTATTFTITPALRQFKTVGGSNALVVWNLYDLLNGDIYGVLSQSDTGGIFFRYQDNTTFYTLHLTDHLASVNPQLAWLTKRVAGIDTTIVGTQAINFVRGEYHTYKISLRGASIVIFYDGIQVMSLSDTSIQLAGNVGYYTNGGTNSYYAQRIQFMGSALAGILLKTKIALTTTDITQTPRVDDLSVTVRDANIARGALYATTNFSYQSSVGGDIDTMAAQSNVYWNIDRFKKLFFKSQSSTPAPWSASSAHGDFMLATQPKIIFNSPLYRNRQYIYNAFSITTKLETHLGDGSTQSWTLIFPVYGLPAITLNNVSVKVGILGQDQGKDFYYAIGSTTISQDVNGVILLATDILHFTYPAGIPYIAMAEDQTQQAMLAAIDLSSGIVDYAEDGQGMLQVDADALAQSRIDEYAQMTSTFTYLTIRSGLDIGMLQVIYAPEFGILNKTYLITGISTTIEVKADGSLLCWYSIECIDGSVLGSWHRFYVNPV